MTGLIYARARWYDPSSGSFLTPDPMGYVDSSNLYAFGAGDPVNNSDPTGECIFGWGGTCAEWANKAKKKFEGAKQYVDQNTSHGFVGVAINATVGTALDTVDTLILDPLRVGDATGTAIGSGASGGQVALALVQDVGRAAAFAAGAGTVVKAGARGTQAARAALSFDDVASAAARGLDEGSALAARELTPAISKTAANVATSARARAASHFPTTAAATDELTDITARAAKITDRLIQNNSTYWARVYNNPALRGERFAEVFARHPEFGRSLIRGNIMDDVAKQMASKSQLPFLRITPRGARGADFTNVFLRSGWDVTTARSWARHVARYANEPYQLYPLLY